MFAERTDRVAHKLDDLDRRIVALLLEDGRLSSAEVTRRLGDTSERTVRYRVERLIRSGVVHVGAVVNPKALGYQVTADVWMEVSPGSLAAVAERVASLPEVSYVAHSTGDRDLSIQVYAQDNEHLHRFVTGVLDTIPGVTRTSTMVVPWKVKDIHQWQIPQQLPARRRGRTGTPTEGGPS